VARDVALNHRPGVGCLAHKGHEALTGGVGNPRRRPSPTPFGTRSSSRPDKARTSTPPGLGGRVDPVDEGLVELGIAGAVGVLPDHRQKRSAASQLILNADPDCVIDRHRRQGVRGASCPAAATETLVGVWLLPRIVPTVTVVWSDASDEEPSPALAPRFSQSATRRGEELAGQPSRSSYLRQTVSSGNKVMGPPGRGLPASKIRLATLPSVFGKEEPTELFAYNDLAEVGRTTPAGRRAAKAALPHFVRRIAILFVAVTVAAVLLDLDLGLAAERGFPSRGCSRPRRRSSEQSRRL